jgi:hypothetical protein
MNEELDLIEAGTGHVTLVGCDEVAEVMEAGGWWALCESAATISPASPRTTSSWGYFQTEAEAKGGGLGTDRGPDWRGEVDASMSVKWWFRVVFGVRVVARLCGRCSV